VIGDARRDGQVSADALDQFAREIKQFCDAKKNALVVELERPDTLERTLKLPRVRGTRSL
jgi:LPS sulfotransferase NodH